MFNSIDVRSPCGQAAKGDNESAEVISNISSQLNGDKLSPEQERLVSEQLKRQEALELRHLEQLRAAEAELEDEEAEGERAINNQVNQQKRLVRHCKVKVKVKSISF
jgi:hypothetical protein